jgi:general secretion pathway protein K
LLLQRGKTILRAMREIGMSETMMPRCRSDRRGTAREDGFALLLVIWITALLALLAAGIAADSQGEARIAQSRLSLAKARLAADAGISLAALGLTEPDPAQRWRADGTARSLRYDGTAITVTVQDEGGKIDLNRAPLELIGGLMDEFDIARADREAILSGIAARRQAFAAQASGPSGDFMRRRRTVDLGEVAFASVAELRTLGIGRAAYDRLRPYLTVYSQNATVNPLTAPRETLLALPGASPQAIDFYLTSRQGQLPGQLGPDFRALGSNAAQYLASLDPGAVTISAKAELGTGVVFTREAVVTMDGSNIPPVKFLEWRRGTAPEPPEAAAGGS